MSFIKYGDGKILDLVDGDDLTENQKKAVKKQQELLVEAEQQANTSKQQKSGS